MAGEGTNSPAEDQGSGITDGAASRNSSRSKLSPCSRTEPVARHWQQWGWPHKHHWLYIGLRANLKHEQQRQLWMQQQHAN